MKSGQHKLRHCPTLYVNVTFYIIILCHLLYFQYSIVCFRPSKGFSSAVEKSEMLKLEITLALTCI